ncbi:MAG: hypothetical protein RBT34_00285 [Anaerolineaceae bacterium]|jgi:hypothetical protein|nr:hypothetical protein [Anaerolineaceae bacterium]
MNFASIGNESVTAYLMSYAVHHNPLSRSVELIWAEFPPMYTKVAAAIWASLVNNSAKSLHLSDQDKTTGYHVAPLRRAYQRFTVDCPNLAQTKEGRPKFVRLVHPDVGKIEGKHGFYILDQFTHSPAQLLAATLENHSPCPVMIGWGEYLLAAAQALGSEYCEKLKTGGPRNVEGYWFSSKIDWNAIVAKGVQKGYLTLEGNCFLPAEIPVSEFVAA